MVTIMKSKTFKIDLSKANLLENMLFRGNGMVSANNSSRLLMDYKEKSPKSYWEILNHIFGEKGINVTHLKLEMGSDINSSSGTEPCVKRELEEKADVRRGAGFMLAADAKKINPELCLDMLWWSEPYWIQGDYSNRYRWYKETLNSAYEIYGLQFDFVSVTQNERGWDYNWIKFFSNALKNESECPYDFGKIKLVAGEEVCTWIQADEILKDEELRSCIDVVGSHYTSFSSDNAKVLQSKYKKELWFSESSSPMKYAQGAARFDGSGLSGLNGMLDIATRFIAQFANGNMTLNEYQPVVAAYYDGVCYCQKDMILANEPWSGFYKLNSGYWMALHFSQFIKKGWAYVDEANFSDAQVGGDGHALQNGIFNYMTCTNPQSEDWSSVIANTTDEIIEYKIQVPDSRKLYVWETRGPNELENQYNENYFRFLGESYTENNVLTIAIKPQSLVSITTLCLNPSDYEIKDDCENSRILELPIELNTNFEEDFLIRRGGAPLYTTDQGGAFEICTLENKNIIRQKILFSKKSAEWGWTPAPTTNFGDDRWWNYSVSAQVRIMPNPKIKKDENYAGIGLRYNLACNGESGYWVKIFENGKCELLKNNNKIVEAKVSLPKDSWILVEISVIENHVEAILNGKKVFDFVDSESVCSAGRAAIYSSWNDNCYSEIRVEPLTNTPYINRLDDTDKAFSYSSKFEHDLLSSYKNFHRTISKGKSGDDFSLEFNGTGFSFFGENTESSEIKLTIDGGSSEILKIPVVHSRGISVLKSKLPEGKHKIKVEILKGVFCVDGAEIVKRI